MASPARNVIDLTAETPPATSINNSNDDEDDEVVVVENEDEEDDDTQWHFLLEMSAASYRYVRIVGIRYYRGVAHPGEYVTLVREPSNPYDRNAIRVDNMRGEKVGHIKRELAAVLSPVMASHGDRLKVDATIPGPGNQFELPLTLQLYTSTPSDGSIETKLASLAANPKAAMKKAAEIRAAAPPPAASSVVVVQARTMDWKLQQKHLDELFEAQRQEQLANLPELEVPKCLVSKLLDHQWTGVRWLVSREKSQDTPFWKTVTENGSTKWLCEVTKSSQPQPPKPVRGSILADDMGLGKTIQAITLLLAHPPQGRDYNTPLLASFPPISTKQDVDSDSDSKVPALKKPTKSAVRKLKLPVLYSVARQAGLGIASSTKDQLVAVILEALDSGTLSIPDFYQTIKDHGPASSAGSVATKSSQTTLIVCPVSVIGNWQEQIETHVAPNTLRVALYHGPDRRELIDAHDPNNPIDVMITSYQTLAHDYRPILNALKKGKGRGEDDYSNPPQNKRPKGMASIFNFPFHRVVLDEAHTIRGSRTGMFHATQALKAEYRLCLTGTPLQNKPEDIQSLFSFLNVEPFCDRDIFRRSISQPIRDGDADTGLGLLRTLMSHFALRRCKSAVAINLPEKTVELREVHSDGDSPHRHIHDAIYDSAKAAIHASMSGEGANRMFLEKNSQSVFEILTRLRQACCSGMLVPPERVERAEQVLDHLKRKAEAGQSLSAEEAMQLLEKLKGALSDGVTPSESGEVSLPECAICMDSLNENCAVVLRRCGHVFCNVCLKTVVSSTNCFGANANKCPFCRLDFTETDMIPWTAAEQAAVKDELAGDKDGSALTLSEQMKQLGPSPKMEALLAGMAEMKEGEKCVIFSQFTKFLDEIGPFLSSRGMALLRIDGSKTQAQRQQALRDFSSDAVESPNVMLCSLHAAGTGINLTRANHIFMMDTWWNKAVESQAFDRVHRIGQTRPVRVVRFVMADSVESRMVQLQEQKAAMGKGVFEALTAEEKRKARFGDIQKLLDLH